MPVVTIIFPKPTIGETIPPKANPNAPNNAEATPAFERSQSKANVLEEVKVNPIIESKQISKISYTKKLQSKQRATIRKNETITIPKLPLYNACSG